jgi:hypothetical protein
VILYPSLEGRGKGRVKQLNLINILSTIFSSPPPYPSPLEGEGNELSCEDRIRSNSGKKSFYRS